MTTYSHRNTERVRAYVPPGQSCQIISGRKRVTIWSGTVETGGTQVLVEVMSPEAAEALHHEAAQQERAREE